jgi:hypothetical protein
MVTPSSGQAQISCVALYLSRCQWLEDECWQRSSPVMKRPPGLVGLEDDVLPDLPAHRLGPTVQVAVFDAVVDPATDPQADQGSRRAGDGHQPHFRWLRPRPSTPNSSSSSPAHDRFRHGLDQVGWRAAAAADGGT